MKRLILTASAFIVLSSISFAQAVKNPISDYMIPVKHNPDCEKPASESQPASVETSARTYTGYLFTPATAVKVPSTTALQITTGMVCASTIKQVPLKKLQYDKFGTPVEYNTFEIPVE